MLVLTGSSRPGIYAPLEARFREALRANAPDVRLIAPTATLVEHLRHRFAREGFVVRPQNIQTLARFAASLAPEAHAVSRPLFHLMVEDALARIAPAEFSRVADSPGFAGALAHTIEMLDTAGVTAQAVAPIARAVADVWRAVDRELSSRSLLTRAGLLRAAAASPVQGTVLFQGFSAFSDPELALVTALARQAEVMIGLPESPASRATCEKLRAAGFTIEREPSQPYSRQFERFAADTVEREAEEIARLMLEEHAAGRAWREMGIALRNPEAYRGILEAALERFNIPVRCYFSTELAQHPAAAYLAATIEALLANWEHEACLRALRLAPRVRTSGQMDRFDFEVRRNLPAQGLAELRALQPAERIEPILAEWDRIDRWRDRRLSPANWAQTLGSLTSLFTPRRIEDGQAWPRIAIDRSQPAALDAFRAVLDEAVAWLGDAPVSLPDFWTPAQKILRMTPLHARDDRRDVVHVMSVYEARQWDLSVLFLCGMAEKEFPRRHPQNPFLSDADLLRLARAGFRVQTSDERYEEETPLFEAACESARDRVVLSYARERKNIPSPLFREAAAGEVRECRAIRPAPAPARKWTPASAIATADLLTALSAQHAAISVSSLESYLQCPFQFFAGRTLRLKPRPERPEDRLNFLERGSIVHDVLAQWLLERPPIAPLFERVFAAKCEKLRIPPCYATERFRHEMLADLERFAAIAAWPPGNPVVTETSMELPLADGVKLTLRIDRLETLPDGSAIVVDYKYSPVQATKNKTEDETKLQGPIYIAAVEQTQPVSAMVYYSLRRDARPFGWGAVPGLNSPLLELTPEWKEAGLETARTAVAQIRAGRILPAPAPTGPCRTCDFRDACRYEQTEVAAVARA